MGHDDALVGLKVKVRGQDWGYVTGRVTVLNTVSGTSISIKNSFLVVACRRMGLWSHLVKIERLN